MNFFYIRRNLILLIFIDLVLLALSYFFAYLTRFEGNISVQEVENIKLSIAPIIICKIFVFYYFDLYKGMWRYTGIVDLINIIKAILTSSLVIVSFLTMYTGFLGFSRSVFLIDAVFALVLISGVRLLIRLILSPSSQNIHLLPNTKSNGYKKLLIIGAGDAGEKVVREIIDNPRMKYEVVGFLDDDKRKKGRHIHGKKVYGAVDEIINVVQNNEIDEILIAVPSASGDSMRRLVELCSSSKIPFKTLPGMGELIDGRVSIKTVRDISYKDLLKRSPVRLENNKIAGFLKDKCIMITGAGGSIGSELCRQICKYEPALIILIDSSESNLYAIQMELKHEKTYLKYRAVLGRVQDSLLMNDIMAKYKPNVIFHAAAYKHVPLIERNPWEAVYSNIIGSNVLVKAAIHHKVERFVLVSSDKAVRPTNVMGTSKRVIEKIIQSKNNDITRFIAVRFGNVIGSSGSVVPLFLNQIKKGGPITVTHPEITRFFMTIEEAAQLILQAFTMGTGGEIFILEMGIPVKIVDMAKDLINFSGKKLEDIKIVFSGLRPGEKLYEELITEGEGIVKTNHEKIMVLRKNGDMNSRNDDNFPEDTPAFFEEKFSKLISFAEKHDSINIKRTLKEIVPEYSIQDDEAVL
ncbi:MAG: polysaccharide biosynthesis protein [Desulfobacteraceae bacterium]|nr:MAG: polysaccharide biosynthesis protein [Desulfobacteraceae bacterium]